MQLHVEDQRGAEALEPVDPVLRRSPSHDSSIVISAEGGKRLSDNADAPSLSTPLESREQWSQSSGQRFTPLQGFLYEVMVTFVLR